jgi:hypothetical protein
MKRTYLILIVFAVSLASLGWKAATQSAVWKPKPKATGAVRVLLVTGGHDHDVEFYSAFEDERIRTVVDPHPAAFSGSIVKRADVLVLYDMLRTLDDKRRENLRAFVESGRGVVVLHHAIGDNVDWPWWYEEVVGGRYLFDEFNGRKSSYRHDEAQTIKPVLDHPITKGIGAFGIFDETYKDLWISPKVRVLLRSDNPTSDGPVAWIGPHEKSRVVYIQLGHDRNAILNPNWQRLVRNAILWTAGT